MTEPRAAFHAVGLDAIRTGDKAVRRPELTPDQWHALSQDLMVFGLVMGAVIGSCLTALVWWVVAR